LKLKIALSFLIFNLFIFTGIAQSATLKGIILDETNTPIENVSIKAGSDGTITNENGFFVIKIPANTDVILEFSHINFKKITQTFNLKSGQELEFNPVMKMDIEQIGEVVLRGNKRKALQGVTTIEPELIRTIKGANQVLKTYLKHFQELIFLTN
jgi:hypothetical protein